MHFPPDLAAIESPPYKEFQGIIQIKNGLTMNIITNIMEV
nr:MAG TPA: hypothetical protein [Caudoviricetes sp.]